MWHHKLRNRGKLLKTVADIGGGSGGLSALSTNLTINGQTVAPTYLYRGQNADLATWTATVGQDASAAGSGGSVDLYTPLASSDRAVDPDGTRYWEGPSTAYGDLGAGDLVFEFVFQMTSLSGFRRLLGKWQTNGYEVFSSSGTIVLRIDDGALVNIGSGALTAGAWYHAMVFCDRSGNAQWYMNGSASGGVIPISGSSGSLAEAQTLKLGAQASGANEWGGGIAQIAVWEKAAWLDTHAQAAVAERRSAQLNGSYLNSLAVGPTQASLRNSVATIEKRVADGTQRWFLVGPRWARLESQRDVRLRNSTGFRVESSHTNLLTYSDALGNAAWTATGLSVTADAGQSAYNEATADALVEDGTTGTHVISQGFTQNASKHVIQAVVEPVNRHWIQLEVESATDGIANAYVCLTDTIVGAESGNDEAGVRYLGNNLYLCWMTDTRATAEAATARVYVADGDGGRSYTGLSQDSVRVSSVLVSSSADAAVSHIQTSAATVTRLLDIIRYAGVSLPASGSFAVDLLREGGAAGNFFLGAISAAGSTNNRVGLLAIASTEVGRLQVRSGAATVADVIGTTGLDGRTWREVRALYDTDDVRLLVDGTSEGTPDTSAALPIGLDRIDIGADNNGVSQVNGLVRVRLFSAVTDKNVTDFGDDMPRASGYISTPAGVAVGTSYTNVGGTFTSVFLDEFTLSAAGVFTYTGAATKRFEVLGACSGAKSGGGSAQVVTAIEKNGATVTSSESSRDVSGTSIGAWAVAADVELANGDTINFAVKISTGTETITFDKLSALVLGSA